MKYKVLVLAAVVVLVYACSAKSSVPTVAVEKANLTPELAEGKSLFENNCANCHQLYAASDFSAAQWKPIVLRMQKKARLDDLQGQKIYNYLTMK